MLSGLPYVAAVLVGAAMFIIGFILLVRCFGMLRKMARKDAPVPQTGSLASYAPQTAAADVPPEVLAAITAAIASVWNTDTGFVVRHVRRVHNAPAWNSAGREDQTYSRL